jgi:hypothetical protein
MPSSPTWSARVNSIGRGLRLWVASIYRDCWVPGTKIRDSLSPRTARGVRLRRQTAQNLAGLSGPLCACLFPGPTPLVPEHGELDGDAGAGGDGRSCAPMALAFHRIAVPLAAVERSVGPRCEQGPQGNTWYRSKDSGEPCTPPAARCSICIAASFFALRHGEASSNAQEHRPARDTVVERVVHTVARRNPYVDSGPDFFVVTDRDQSCGRPRGDAAANYRPSSSTMEHTARLLLPCRCRSGLSL